MPTARSLLLWLTLLFAAVQQLPAARADEAAWRVALAAIDYDPLWAIEDARQQLALAERRHDKPAQLFALRRLYWALDMSDTRADGGLSEFSRGEALAIELGDQEALLDIRTLRAWHLTIQNQDAQAKALFDEIIADATRLHLQTRLAWALSNSIELAEHQGRRYESLKAIQRAFEIFKSEGDEYGIANMLEIYDLPLGMEYVNSETKEVSNLDAALSIAKRNGYRNMAAVFYLQMANRYNKTGNYERAMEPATAGRAIARALRKYQLAALLEMAMARSALGLQQYQRSLEYATEESLAQLQRLEDRYPFAKSTLVRAAALTMLNRKQEALGVLARVKPVLLRLPNLHDRIDVLSEAADIYIRLADYKAASELLQAYRDAMQQSIAADNAKLSSESALGLKVQQKDMENTLLRAQREQAEARRLIAIMAWALTLFVFGAIVFWLRRRVLAAHRDAATQKMLADAEARANAAKSTFLAAMSHELRSPLNAILGFSRLLARRPEFDADVRHDLAIVLRNGEHLYALINQVLDISKIEAGEMTLNEAGFDLPELFAELESMFSLPAMQKHLTLSFDVDAAVPHHVHADGLKLRQVLINLINNAIKFTETGGITVRVCASAPGEERSRLAISVADTGVGIAPEEVAQLGRAFVQAQAGRAASEGTGLGLAICDQFVRLMGGELRIESTVGEGTTMSFELEVGCAAPAAHADGPARRVTALLPGQPAYRILAVDDREEGRQLLARLLAPLGFEIREAANGEEALAQWQAWQPHLIFMDMRMPVMDGREAAHRIRESPGGENVIIVAMTASSYEEERKLLLADGYDAYLGKPFQETKLFAVLAERLGVRFAYAEDMSAAKDGEAMDAARLRAVPADVLRSLEEALQTLDIDRIAMALEAVRTHDASVAATLEKLSDEFQYERMLAWLAPAC
jgi:signal transduction histidine kinase/DNA-binding response OmpR family regulator